MINSDYKYQALENFKFQGNKYQIHYDTTLNHIKNFYEIKCKAISYIKAIKDILIKLDDNNSSYRDIIDQIDSACILFEVDNNNSKIDNDISLEPTTALAIKTSLDNKSLRELPMVPSNCIALAYILQKEKLSKIKGRNYNSISSAYILGGKLIGKLILGTLGPASLLISGLSLLNKSMKNDAKAMELAREIEIITNRLAYQIKNLQKIDLKICCLKDELYSSIDTLKSLNTLNIINDKNTIQFQHITTILAEISSICNILQEKI